MMLARTGPRLGFGNLKMIPSWQLSNDPLVNPKINPFVKFPEGWNQRTVQPVGPWMGPPRENMPQLSGLFDSWAWQNRKWLVLGGVGLLAAGILTGVTALLK